MQNPQIPALKALQERHSPGPTPTPTLQSPEGAPSPNKGHRPFYFKGEALKVKSHLCHKEVANQN